MRYEEMSSKKSTFYYRSPLYFVIRHLLETCHQCYEKVRVFLFANAAVGTLSDNVRRSSFRRAKIFMRLYFLSARIAMCFFSKKTPGSGGKNKYITFEQAAHAVAWVIEVGMERHRHRVQVETMMTHIPYCRSSHSYSATCQSLPLRMTRRYSVSRSTGI